MGGGGEGPGKRVALPKLLRKSSKPIPSKRRLIVTFLTDVEELGRRFLYLAASQHLEKQKYVQLPEYYYYDK